MTTKENMEIINNHGETHGITNTHKKHMTK